MNTKMGKKKWKIMNQMIKFSIIVPVYNVELYLRECINSILSQTYPIFELILVNDGSTDDCLSICEEYSAVDGRIILINQENQGLLAARRVGLNYAKGDYIVHIDSDDYCAKTLLEQLYEKIKATNSDLILFGYSKIDVSGNISRKLPTEELPMEKGYISKESLIEAMINSCEYNSLVMKCARRSIVDFNEDYSKYGRLQMGEDLLQSIPLVENASRITNIDAALYMYRSTEDSMSRKLQKEYIYHYLMVRRRLYETLCKYYTNPQKQKVFFERYHHGVASYLIKSTTVYDRRDYIEMVDDIKQYLIDCEARKGCFASLTDELCYRLGIGKHYLICKMIAYCI